MADQLTIEQRLQAFASALREALVISGMTQAELAKAVGYNSQGAIANFLAGKNFPENPDTVFAMEQALGVTPGGLSRHLGYMPPEAFQTVATFKAALEADTALTVDEKDLFLAMYERATARRNRKRKRPGA